MDSRPALAHRLKHLLHNGGTKHELLGVLYQMLGENERAIAHHKTSLDQAEVTNDFRQKGSACENLGYFYHSLGQYDKAMEFYNMHLDIAKETGDNEGAGKAYESIGSCYHSLGQYDKAFEYCQKHFSIAKQSGDMVELGRACTNLGNCLYPASQYEKAMVYYRRRLNIAKHVGDMAGEGLACENLGNCFYLLGQYHKALEYYDMDLNIAVVTGNMAREGRAFGNLGVCFRLLGRYEKAIEYQEMHLDVAKQIGDKRGEGNAYGNLGICYYSLGKREKAMEYHETQLNILKQTGDKAGEGKCYGNLGICLYSLGQYDKAMEYHKMDLNIAKQNKDKEGEGLAYGNLGLCYQRLGQYAKAIEYHELKINIAKQTKNKAEEGSAHGNLGNCYYSLGQYNKALKHLQMFLSIAKHTGNEALEGVAYSSIGSCLYFLGRPDKAKILHEMHLNIAKRIGDKEGEGIVYSNLGRCLCDLGQYRKAKCYHEMQLTIAKQTGDKPREGMAYTKLGNCYQALGQLNNSERAKRQALEIFESLFASFEMSDELKVSFLDTFTYTYSQIIVLLLLQTKNHEALCVAERGRSKALAELIRNSHSIQRAEVTTDICLNVSDIRKVVENLDTAVIYYECLPCYGIVSWVIKPSGLVKTYSPDLLQQVEEEHFGEHEVPSIGMLKSTIETAMEKFRSGCEIQCEDRSLSFLYQEGAPTQKKAESSVLTESTAPRGTAASCSQAAEPEVRPLSSAEDLEEIARHFTRDPARENEGKEAQMNGVMNNLYRIVFGSVLESVDGSDIVIVPDGPLALVPFAALVAEDGRYVADSLRIRLVPSLATAKMILEHPQDMTGATPPLIVGNPSVDYVLKNGNKIRVPDLPWAEREARGVAYHTGGQLLIGDSATKAKFLELFETAKLIHIAAHGDESRGEILLAPCPGSDHTPKNVMLTMADLEGKHLKAQLVVLSCCHSGRGEIKGEGLIGIACAFFGAGARAVLASLWVLNDTITVGFMKEFYEHLLAGEKVSEALDNTTKAMRKYEQLRHPRYWAPFVVIGDNVAPFSKPLETDTA